MEMNVPLADFVLSDFERLFDMPKNTAYKAIQRGKLRGHRNECGQWRVAYTAAVEYAMRQRASRPVKE